MARALRYIRQNADHGIRACDAARASLIAQCSIYARFKRILGHSILDEIRKVRVERVAELLLTTDLTVSQIADKLDFSAAGNMANRFGDVKGITPLKYRRKYADKAV